MKRTLLILGALALAGCATGTKIATGPPRPAVSMDAVQVYAEPPAGAEQIGIVTATASGRNQAAVDAAVQQLRFQASRLGANGIVITGQSSDRIESRGQVGLTYANGLTITPGASTSTETTLNAKAILVMRASYPADWQTNKVPREVGP
jgi:hypothetical protein